MLVRRRRKLEHLLSSSFSDAREDARDALSARMRDIHCRDTTAAVCAAWMDVVGAERAARLEIMSGPGILDTDAEMRPMLLLLLEAFDTAEAENTAIVEMVARADTLNRRDRTRLNQLLESGLKLSEALERTPTDPLQEGPPVQDVPTSGAAG